MADIIVREIKESDIEGFNVLMDQLVERAKDQEKLLNIIRKVIADENRLLLVAYDNETKTVCGTMLGIVTDDFCYDLQPIMYIENVVTHENYRRMGIGKKMFEKMENFAKEKNCYYAELCSSLNRTQAHIFYNKIGYEDVKGFRKFFS